MDITTNPNMSQEYFNPADGQTYTMKQQVPGQGAVMVNKTTQEESMLPQTAIQQMQQNQNQTPGSGTITGLKPVMKTTRRNVMATDLDELNNSHDDVHEDTLTEVPSKVQDHLMEDINHTIDAIQEEEQGIEGDIDSILEDTSLFNELSEAQPEDPVEVIKSVEVPGGPQTDVVPKDKVDDIVGEELNAPVHPLSELNKNLLANNNLPMKVKSVHKTWRDIRASFAPFGPKSFEERQLLFVKKAGLAHMAKELGFNPDKREPDDSGHSKVNNIPIAVPPKEKDKTIGMTEFPKGQKTDDSIGLNTGKGYNIPMKEMDENQVANREKFDNEQRQMLNHMTIREFRALMDGTGKKEREAIEKGKGIQPEREPVKPEKHSLYDDIESKAILKLVGLVSFSDITDAPVPKTPISFEEKKTAPKSDSYREPALIPPSQGKVKEALTKLLATQQELEELKSKLATDIKPHQESITRFQQEQGPGIKTKQELLQSYVDMAYNQIDATSEKVVYYAKTIWARLSEMSQTKPQVTVAQVIDEALKIDEKLAMQIKELKDKLESAQGGSIEKRRLYQFPVTPSTEKKLAPEASIIVMGAMHDNLVAALARFVATLTEVDAEIATSLEELGE